MYNFVKTDLLNAFSMPSTTQSQNNSDKKAYMSTFKPIHSRLLLISNSCIF